MSKVTMPEPFMYGIMSLPSDIILDFLQMNTHDNEKLAVVRRNRRREMFGALKSLGKAAVGLVVETPLAVVADAVTLGGVLTDKKEPYTKTALGKVVENVENATDPNDG